MFVIFLLLSLVSIGFIKSIILLFYPSDKKPPKVVKMLTVIYFVGCIVGIIVVVVQGLETKEFEVKVGKIFNTVVKLDTASQGQLVRLNNVISNTSNLLDKADSLNGIVEMVNHSQDSLLTQYRVVNGKLSAQIELDKMRLKADAAYLQLIDAETGWYTKDSLSFIFSLCLRNLGRRDANISQAGGVMLLFDANSHQLRSLKIPWNTQDTRLPPSIFIDSRVCSRTSSAIDLSIFEKARYAIYCYKVYYQDVLDGVPKDQTFYRIWNASAGIGSMSDQNVEKIQRWMKENKVVL